MAMDDNPYAAPRNPRRAPVGVKSGLQKDVRDVAVYQKAIMICILVYLGCVGVQIVGTASQVPALQILIAIVAVINALTGVVFVFLLAMKVYQPVAGVFLAILALVPCLGLLILLIISSKATAILRSNGYEVGFLGANLNQIPG